VGNAPASAREALDMVRTGLGYLAAADAAELGTAAQAECLRELERADAALTAARSFILAGFTAGQGYSADAEHSPRAWLILILSFGVSQGCDLRRPVVDSVAGGRLRADCGCFSFLDRYLIGSVLTAGRRVRGRAGVAAVRSGRRVACCGRGRR
jgi:hypothetical protein